MLNRANDLGINRTGYGKYNIGPFLLPFHGEKTSSMGQIKANATDQKKLETL
jgi:hypothetical protein